MGEGYEYHENWATTEFNDSTVFHKMIWLIKKKYLKTNVLPFFSFYPFIWLVSLNLSLWVH